MKQVNKDGFIYDPRWSYEGGLLPKSKILAAHLKMIGITESLKTVKQAISDGHIKPTEYRLTGGEFENNTGFFHLLDLKKKIKALGGLQQFYPKNQPIEKPYRVKGRCISWKKIGNGHNRNGFVTFNGIVKGGWIYLDNGMKKKANGRYITYERI